MPHLHSDIRRIIRTIFLPFQNENSWLSSQGLGRVDPRAEESGRGKVLGHTQTGESHLVSRVRL